jgi:hypothetical protein
VVCYPFARKHGKHQAVKRRDFITLVSGAAATWPLAARAQRGVFMSLAADDKQAQARLAAFLQGLQELGWTDGRNVRIDVRWGAGDADRNRRQAAELIGLAPDVILASGGSIVGTRPTSCSATCGCVPISRRATAAWSRSAL